MADLSLPLIWAVAGGVAAALLLLFDVLRAPQGGLRRGVHWRCDDAGEGRVALTIGGSLGSVSEAAQVPGQLAALADHGAHATFFVRAADATANADELRRILSAGHELGCSVLPGEDESAAALTLRDAVGVTPRFFRCASGWPLWRARRRGDDVVRIGWAGSVAERAAAPGTIVTLGADTSPDALRRALERVGPCTTVSSLIAVRPYVEAPDRGWTGRMRGGRFGPATFRLFLRCGGLPAAHVLLLFVAAWFTAFHGNGRRASIALRRRLHGRASPVCELWWVYRHFYEYGRALVLRADFLIRGAEPPPADYRGLEAVEPIMRAPGGVILISAHVGDWMRAGPRVNLHGRELSIVAVRGAGAGPAQVSRDAGKRPFNVIDAEQDPTAIGMAMVAALSGGHAVALLADRAVGGRSVRVPFLGAEAEFPIGPWAIALATRAPVVVFFALPARGRRLMIELTGPFHVTRGKEESRDDALRRAVEDFAEVLADTVRRYPFDWGNFFDFWSAE